MKENIDYARSLEKPASKLLSLATLLSQKKNENQYNPKDLRDATLDVLEMMCVWGHMQMYMYSNYIAGPSSSSILSKIIKDESKTKNNEYQKAMNDFKFNFDITNRTSFLTIFLFRVEVFLSGINEILPLKSTDNRISKISTHVLKQLFPRDWQKKSNIIIFSSELRNSLHAGGIYQKTSKKFEVKDEIFELIQNETPMAGWEDITKYCEYIIELLFEIIDSLEIKKIQKINKKIPNNINYY